MVKFLLIRFSSIGDIVLTSPVVRNLKQQVDQAEIHFLTKPAFADILKANPYITKIHTLDENLNGTIHSLRIENPDYVIDLQNNLKSLQIKRALRRMYFTINKLNIRKWLYVNFKLDTLPYTHIVDRYLETLTLFDVINDHTGLEYYIPKEDYIAPSNLPKNFQKGFISLVIGANHETKKLTVDQLAYLAGEINMPLVLIGGPEDHENGEFIIRKSEKEDIFNGCGRWNINQSASVIEHSAVIITHDTGMMHIAAAFKKDILTVWGNTTPRFGMRPYFPGKSKAISFEVNNLRCRPCSKLGRKSCPKKHFRCMLDQDLDQIADTANQLLGNPTSTAE